MQTHAGFKMLAAAALLSGFAIAAGAQDGSSAADCPEDGDTAPGCENTAPVSEPGPVEGAATAPVSPDGSAGEGDATMTGPDSTAPAEGDATSEPDTTTAAPAETGGDAMDSAAADEADCPEDSDTAPGCGNTAPVSEPGPVEGAATAPVSPDGSAGEGDATMDGPDDAEPAEGDAASSTEESSDAAAAGDNVTVSYDDNGRYYTADDVPTFNVAADGTVDWLTYSGFRRYHSECHVCHGPDGEGSSYAPALKESAMNMDYYDFYNVVVNGIQHVDASSNQVMPAFGTNENVMCYLDDIYVYLKARGAGAIERGRPANKEAKSDMIQEAENACMGA